MYNLNRNIEKGIGFQGKYRQREMSPKVCSKVSELSFEANTDAQSLRVME